MALKAFIRQIKLALDRTSAQTYRRDAQEALDKGTDPKGAEKNLGRLEKTLLKLGGVLAGVFAIKKISQWGAETIRIANESDAIWNRLKGTLATAGVEFAKVEGDIRATARALQDVSTVGDEQFAEVLTTLVGMSRDYSGSLKNVQVVADLAAAKQLDLQTAAMLVGKAMIGETGTLKRYGIVVEEGGDAIEVMRKQFAGMATNELAANPGLWKALRNEIDDWREALGRAMTEGSGAQGVLRTLIEAFKNLTAWTERNSKAISAWIRGGLMVLIEVGRGVFQVFAAITDLFSVSFFGTLAFVTNGLSRMTLGFSLATRAAAKLLDLIGADTKAAKVHEFADAIERQAEALKEWSRTAAETAAGSAIDFIGRFAGTAHAQSGLPAVTAATIPIADVADVGGGGTAGPRRVARTGAAVAPVGMPAIAAMKKFEDVRGARLQAMMDREAEWWLEYNQSIVAGIETTTMGFADAWLSAFDQIREDGDDLGSFMETLGRGIGGALLGGLTAYAGGKMRESLAEGIQETARGFGALALGNPMAGLHFKSAAGHFAAVAAWGALSGALGSASGAVAERSSGASGATAGGGLRTAQRAEPRSSEMHVHFIGEGFKAVNPEVQRVVMGSIQESRSTLGKNVKVRVHRSS